MVVPFWRLECSVGWLIGEIQRSDFCVKGDVSCVEHNNDVLFTYFTILGISQLGLEIRVTSRLSGESKTIMQLTVSSLPQIPAKWWG